MITKLKSSGFSILLEKLAASPAYSFFMGKKYPLAVGALVLIGHLTGLEVYFASVNVVLFAVAIAVTASARPAIPFVLTFLYQVTVNNAPSHPSFSDYYFTGGRIVLVVLLALVIALSAVLLILRNDGYRGLLSRRTPMLISLLIFSSGMLLNGAFSPEWTLADGVFGLAQGAAYTLLYLFFLGGLRLEDREELLDYLIFSSAVTATVLIGEVGGLYLFGDVISAEGGIIKDNILFGWGIWNTAGVCLAVLIPILFLGVMRSLYPLLYLALAVLTMGATALTLSRNALLFGGLFFIVCALISAFCGRSKRLMRWVVCAGVALVALGGILFFDKISVLFADIFNRGFSDNGRYELWRTGIDNFLRSPLFGVGFFGFVSDTFVTTEFLPDMAHQTLITLLSATGIVGTVCYGVYRCTTLVPFLRRPSAEKTMLLCSVLVLIAESLLDNFVFYILPTFHYTVTLAVAVIISEGEREEKNSGKKADAGKVP